MADIYQFTDLDMCTVCGLALSTTFSGKDIFSFYNCHISSETINILNILVKGKAEHLYSALHGIQTTLKHLGMVHTV